MVTIIEVARSMGIELSRDTAWALGAMMARRWADTFGEQPEKRLRPKTSGGGSHCFAVYPDSWVEPIKAAIKDTQLSAANQLSLFHE
jgi:hypothetical protein